MKKQYYFLSILFCYPFFIYPMKSKKVIRLTKTSKNALHDHIKNMAHLGDHKLRTASGLHDIYHDFDNSNTKESNEYAHSFKKNKKGSHEINFFLARRDITNAASKFLFSLVATDKFQTHFAQIDWEYLSKYPKKKKKELFSTFMLKTTKLVFNTLTNKYNVPFKIPSTSFLPPRSPETSFCIRALKRNKHLTLEQHGATYGGAILTWHVIAQSFTDSKIREMIKHHITSLPIKQSR